MAQYSRTLDIGERFLFFPKFVLTYDLKWAPPSKPLTLFYDANQRKFSKFFFLQPELLISLGYSDDSKIEKRIVFVVVFHHRISAFVVFLNSIYHTTSYAIPRGLTETSLSQTIAKIPVDMASRYYGPKPFFMIDTEAFSRDRQVEADLLHAWNDDFERLVHVIDARDDDKQRLPALHDFVQDGYEFIVERNYLENLMAGFETVNQKLEYFSRIGLNQFR